METPQITTPGTSPYTAGQTTRPISSDFETFLRMLTVQLQNQDPLNPVEASDYAVQLATFSGVEQQVLTNDLLRGLAGQIALTGLAQMGGWIGREVRAAAPAWFDGAPVEVVVAPLARADEAQLVVHDSAGVEVQRQNLPLAGGPLQWAGASSDGAPLPAGLYTFTVESWAGDALIASETAEVYAKVTEVQSRDGDLILTLAGGAEIDGAAVSAIRG